MRPTRSTGALAAALCCILAIAVSCGPPVSDTGFVGTWQRVGDASSKIGLREEPDGFRFRWAMHRGPRIVRCDAESHCEEFEDGVKKYDQTFRVSRRADTAELLLECTGTPVAAGDTPFHYVDRLVLQPGGRELWSYKVEENGAPAEQDRPPIRFTKVADDPF